MPTVLAFTVIVASVVGVVGFFGSVVVYIRGSSDKGTITTLKTYSDAQDRRISQLEADAVRATAEILRLSERLGVVENERDDLRRQRPSAEAIAELHGLVENYAALLARHDAQTLALLRKVVPK